MKKWQSTVEDIHNGLRLDKYLASQFSEVSRSHFSYLIREGKVVINDEPVCSPKYKVKSADHIRVEESHKSLGPIPLCDIDIDVVYEDKDLIVINKPYNLIVHPVGKTMDSVVGALLNKKIELSCIDPERPGVVHRLDKTTSGLMILAKNDETHLKLVSMFKKRELYKEYLTVVRGRLMHMKGEIDVALKRIPGTHKMKVSDLADAKQSLTHYEVIKSDKKANFHLVRIDLKTGRMHQIRVHMKHIGCPVVGDTKYGGVPAERIMLHAHKLKFKHPVTGENKEFVSSPPDDFDVYFR